MRATENSSASRNPKFLLRGRWVGPVLLLIVLLLSAVALELVSRAYWSGRRYVPFGQPGLVLYAFYPGLARIDALRPSRHDAYFDVLILGGSTLHPNFGAVGQALRERLLSKVPRKVRIFNLAFPGHTSRDAALQYAAVGESRFDLVILYHGLNDARANNVPPEVFKSDYSHFAWYAVLNVMRGYHGRAHLALPYSLHYVWTRIGVAGQMERYSPLEGPRDEWVRFGAAYRSKDAFETNLTSILDRARQVGDRVVLMTTVLYVPANYSFERFQNKQLDYQLHLTPLELWGEPKHVQGAVAAHNEVVRALARRYGDVVLVDQDRLMERGGRYFNDAAHFTVLGSAVFADHLVSARGVDPEEAGDERRNLLLQARTPDRRP
ncbi:MAG: SGNH/GDSL hydrolase family protein [Actinomycetota bacterium]